MKKVAFLTTVFPMKEKYMHDFLNSVANQTYKNFDLIVVNDGFENFHHLRNHYKSLSIIELHYSSTPALNRAYGINFILKQGYDIIVFGDSDDYFANNRVALSVERLKSADIIVNDLSLVDEDKNLLERLYISHRVHNNSIIDYDFLKDKNICGLSNTALKTTLFEEKVDFPSTLVAVDWYLYRSLLAKGYKALFTNETETFYRQYGNNTLGLKQERGKYLLWWEEE